MAYTPCCKSVKIMGNRVTQQILTCDLCGETPENGEHMWEMGREVWCEECCKKQEDESDAELVDIEITVIEPKNNET